jgi:hypothetical protein
MMAAQGNPGMIDDRPFDCPCSYQIHIKGQLDASWADWFGGFELHQDAKGTVLTGAVPDQPALYGLLARICDLGLVLLSVERVEPREKGKE